MSKLIGVLLLILGLLGSLMFWLEWLDPVSAQLADDNNPFGPPPIAGESLMGLFVCAVIALIGLWFTIPSQAHTWQPDLNIPRLSDHIDAATWLEHVGCDWAKGLCDKTIPLPVMIGFLPKQWSDGSPVHRIVGVEAICSASECLVPGPSNRLDVGGYNDYYLYDTEAAAWRVVDVEQEASAMFAYLLFPIEFHDVPLQVSIKSVAAGNFSEYEHLGYDVVNFEPMIVGFGCSPLSCAGAHTLCPVNRFCLVNDLEEAWKLAQHLGDEDRVCHGPEGAPYFLCAVWRKKSPTT